MTAMTKLAASSVSLLVLVGLILAPDADAKGKAEVVLPEGFPALEHDDARLSKVPGIDSAPAVVLLQARQQEWEGTFARVNYYYRIKILNEDGVANYGDFTYELRGDWRVKKVQARTLLPGGEEIDAAEGIFRERSGDGFNVVNVAWPQVQVGAILDLHVGLTIDYSSIPEWIVQGYLPVLESRFVLIPPPGLIYSAAVHGFPEEASRAKIHRTGRGRVHVWTFKNVPALPREPNQPPLMDIAKTLFVVPTDIRDPFTDVNYPLARDWKSVSHHAKEVWDAWIEEGSSEAESLAREAVGEGITATEKAEAIRKALEERVQVEHISDQAIHGSPNEVLSKGTATTGEIAATAVAMLRGVNVEADLAGIRLRTSGLIPPNMPVPALFNDLLVRIRDGEQYVFFSPASNLPVGSLPWNRRGVMALPYDGRCRELVSLDDYSADENRSVATVQAELDATGRVVGQSRHTYYRVAAQRWRKRLEDLDEEERRERIQSRLRRWMPGLQVTSYKIEYLDDHTQELVIQSEWEVERYAGVAPSRLLVNLQMIERLSADDWPEQQRTTAIHLGEAFESSAVVVLALPENVKEIALPDNALMRAGPVGVYQAKYERQDGRITGERYMRLDRYWFPAEAYTGLSRWFRDIAAADDRAAVIKL